LDKTILIDGAINPDKLKEIKSFNTYAELSPTVEEGGLRAFCYGSFPAAEGVHAGNTEIYQYGKFLTITGHKLNDAPATIKDAQEALTVFRAKYFQPLSEIDDSNLPFTSVKFTDNELHLKIGTSKLGAQFKELYYGGYSEADDKSTIDLKLCRMLVFLTQDIEQIDRIFRQSALFRPKWDEIHGHDTTGPLTYGQKTINYALKTRTTVYNPTNVNEPLNDFISFSLSGFIAPSIRIVLSKSTPISVLFPSCGGSGESAILSPLYFLEDLRRDKASSKVIHVSGSSQEAGFTSFSPVALFICHDKGSLPGLDLPVII